MLMEPLFVAQPLLPDLAEFQNIVAEVWRTKTLTNGGPFHQRLEAELERYLDVPTAMLFNNGTVALMAALKLFDLPAGSEVITTPLTFAATAHAVHWNGLKPVFVDVLPDALTIDPAAVQKAITSKTSAILAVHVYGTVCEVDQLQAIADQHGLRLIYDSAHVFGTTINGRSIGSYGDASVFSFHATKLFNTLEGGLISTNRASDKADIYYLRNFGIKSEDEVISVGLNGKMNELQAAFGLLNLPRVPEERRQRSELRQKYEGFLTEIPGITTQLKQPGVTNAEQYFPIIINQATYGLSRDDIYDRLKARGIYARKYFHPICTDFVPYRDYPVHSIRNTPYVNTVKSQVLCLPFHSGVSDRHVADIKDVFQKAA